MDTFIAIVWWMFAYPLLIVGVWASIVVLRLPVKPEGMKDNYKKRQKGFFVGYLVIVVPLLLWTTFYYQVPQQIWSALNSSSTSDYSNDSCDRLRDAC